MILWFGSAVLAAGVSADIELVAPPAAPGGGFATEGGDVLPHDTARVVTLVQVEDEPLVQYAGGYRVGAVVGTRASAQLAAAIAVTDGLSLRVGMPFVGQWGTEVPQLGADGAGLGDLVVGARVQVASGESGGTAFFVDQHVPSGRKEAWLGDEKFWRVYGLGTSYDAGRVRLAYSGAFAVRPPIDTPDELEFGFELRNGFLLGFEMTPRVEVLTELLARMSARGLGQGGTPGEALAGVRWKATEALAVDAAAGLGVSRGYGTTKSRGLVAVTWTPRTRAKEPEPVVVEVPPPPEPMAATDERASVDVLIRHEWIDGELARIEGDQIVIKEPILFELGTERILPESLPVLDDVARILAKNDRIAHVVIEGHASPEGEFADNYDLSVRRARSVFERLLLVGVGAERLSYRGVGEVVPTTDGRPIEDQRRVEFHIVSQLGPLEIAKPPRPDPKLPWSGEPQEAP